MMTAEISPVPVVTGDAFQEAARFLSLLFAPEDIVLLRPIEAWLENGKKRSRTLWKQTDWRPADRVSDAVFQSFLRVGETERANIFFGVAPRFGIGGYDFAWQIRTIRTLWADVDDVPPNEAIARCLAHGLPRPSIVVGSGTLGGHLYWLLSEPYLIDDVGPPPRVLKEWTEIEGKKRPIHFYEDPATGQKNYLDDPLTGTKLQHPALSAKAAHFRRVIQGIAASIGGDHTIDPTRLLRLPGTMNRKDERNGRAARPCRMLECNGERFDFGQFVRFAEVTVPGKPKRQRKSVSKTLKPSSPLPNTPVPTDDEIIARIAASKQGEKFQLLMSGMTDEYGGDESRADEALCCMLAYWTRDKETIERLFRRSELCDEKWTSRPDYRELTIGHALDLVHEAFDWQRARGNGASPIAPIPLTDELRLEIVNERILPSGTVSVQVKLLRGDASLQLLKITSTLSSQKDAVKQLDRHLKPTTPPKTPNADVTGDAPSKAGSLEASTTPAPDLQAIIGKLLADAHERLTDEAAEAAENEEQSDSVRDIVFQFVPKKFDLKYRMGDGKAWSELWKRPVSRLEFISHVPATLIDAAKRGRDAESEEPKHVRAVQIALGVLWSSLMEFLPMQAVDADLPDDSEDARRMRGALVRVWTKPVLLKNVPVGNGKDLEAGQARASLASLVEEAFRPYVFGKQAIGGREKWRPLRTAVAAWWRPVSDDGGLVVPLLAMRYDLFDHLGIPFDGVTDQASLRRLGTRYGVFSGDPGVTDRMSGGGRLAILTHALREEILSQPTDEADDPHSGDSDDLGDSGSAVTEGSSSEEDDGRR